MGDKKPSIYLAGPMAGCTDEECCGWRDEVTETLEPLYEILSPMVRDFRQGYHRYLHQDLIVEGDKSDCDKADIILANIWKNGTGTTMEILYSWMKGKTVYLIAPGYNPNDDGRSVSPWYSYHCHLIFPSVNDAIQYLKRIRRAN